MSIEAVLLVGFGGPERPEDIRPFLDNVLRGRPVPPERYEEVVHHYLEMGGRSPYNDFTFLQAQGLRKLLKREGPELPVYVGMRNWNPYLADVLVEMAQAGIREALGIILAPHQGEASWGRYQAAVRQASDVAGLRMIQPAPLIRYSDPWFDHPYFVEAQADKLKCKASKIPYDRRSQAKLLFVAHSVPVSVASLYVEQLRVSCDAVAVEAGFSEWELVYQSRSGNPRDPWLEPDIGAALAKRAEEGVRDVIVVPISFVSDHVEVLFDLDREAAQLAAEKGMGYYRVCTVHDHPSFIRMLADLVRKATHGSASP